MFVPKAFCACLALTLTGIAFGTEIESTQVALGGSATQLSSSMASLVAVMKSESPSTGVWVLAESYSDGTSKWKTNVPLSNIGSASIEYVVNCNQRSVALASLAVPTNNGLKVIRRDENLAFYKPKMAIDSNLMAETCNSQVAMNALPQNN